MSSFFKKCATLLHRKTIAFSITVLFGITLLFLFHCESNAQGRKENILVHGLAAICDNCLHSAELFKKKLLQEAKDGKFAEPAHSMKIKQTWAMYRGYYYLKVNKLYPSLFSDEERNVIVDWFIKVTERTFTIEWSDLYYALAFRKSITAPYRNQENGAGALIIFAEIIKHKRPDLARKAVEYVKDNAVMWKRNFRNTDDSILYQAVWIYNCYNVAHLLYPKWLNNGFSKMSFDWLKNQWPPDGAPLGYNPDPDTLVPDIMYLGAHLHKDGTYKWLGDRMMEYALKHKKKLSGFRPGLAFKNDNVKPIRPTTGSLYMEGPGNLVQFPSKNKPDKIIFRDGWEPDDFYALLNLRFDGWHGYKGTNSFISVRYGKPFVVEDLVKKSRDWLPKGRAKRRDENICRSRLNGFQIEGSLFRMVMNKIFGFEDSWEQDVPKFTKVEHFIASEELDVSRTTISNWKRWDNTRISLLVKDDYFVVFDFNRGRNKKNHAISWHLRGELNRKGNEFTLRQGNYTLSLFLCSDNAEYILESSKEDFPPEAEDFEADYDIFMQSVSDGSEMVSLFWPKRKNTIHSVRKIEDSNPHVMIVKVDTLDFQDTVIVRDGRIDEVMKFEGVEFDSDLIVVRKMNTGTVIFYKTGNAIEKTMKSN